MSRRLFALLLCAAGLTSCATKGPCPPLNTTIAGQSDLPNWHDVITMDDHQRLRAWRKSLVDAIAAARSQGHGPEIDTLGALLDPDVALDNAAMPLGFYRCRVIKLGEKPPTTTQFAQYPPHRCEVRPSDDLTRIVQLDGLQRPSGRLYPDGPSRMVFLGTMILSDETLPITYGRDEGRNMVGVLQRVGETRWRLLLPKPSWESQVSVMEFTPAT